MLELGVRATVRVKVRATVIDQGTKRLGTKKLGYECLEAIIVVIIRVPQ